MKTSYLKTTFCIILMCMFMSACRNSTNTEAILRGEIAGLREQISMMEAEATIAPSATGKITHTVMFTLKHPQGSPAAKAFIDDARRILSDLPPVENFRAQKQVSAKNALQYYFTMEFADEAAYQAYNNHPDHVKFVKERWDTEVIDFLEADFVDFAE